MAMRIAYAVARQIADLAQAQVPHEVCGLLAGKGDDISKCLPVSNIAGSREDQYELDPGEELKALKAIDAAGLRWIGDFSFASVFARRSPPPPISMPRWIRICCI